MTQPVLGNIIILPTWALLKEWFRRVRQCAPGISASKRQSGVPASSLSYYTGSLACWRDYVLSDVLSPILITLMTHNPCMCE